MSIIKIGGSLLFEDGTLRTERIINLTEIIERYSDSIDGLVIGGGNLARQYISVGKEKELTTDELDWLGINATHANAKFIGQLLNGDYTFCQSIDDVTENENTIMGGTEPGHTTDAVAIMLAKKLDADEVYVLSDVDGIYDTRNNSIENADLLDEASTETIESIIEGQSDSPGRNIPLDGQAVEILSNTSITVTMIDGTEPRNLLEVLEGSDLGTTVNP